MTRLGPQPDDETAIVALLIFRPAEVAALIEEYGDLPATRHLGSMRYFRVPARCARDMPPGGIALDHGAILIAPVGEIAAAATGEVADLPVAWLSTLITASAQLDARASRVPHRQPNTPSIQ